MVPVSKKLLTRRKSCATGAKVPQTMGDDKGDAMNRKIAPVFLSVMFFSLLGHFRKIFLCQE